MTFTGRVWKFGDDIDTDIIMPTQHLSYASMDEIKSHIFEPLRPELAKLVQPGDIIVGGSNFGCGSSREQAAEILAYAGIKAIVAKSFARIFFRNSINNGMLLIECPELPDEVAEGDVITVNINKCIEHKGKEYAIPYLSDNLYRLVRAGGLVKSTKKQNGVL
ncbi:MAG: 3-isopropylmalate dehydratase [Phascolarctobacterium sp.]|nr:3-isopropylmalate dehydratase [Phascolarctobacterium sp.]